jgi:transcriptional/translational regulatory protein YebC/TACO1
VAFFSVACRGLILCAMDSARFATVMFMFRHQGRVRLVLSEQDAAAGGGVDRLFDNALAADAEDFDQVPGADRGVEVEVRSVPLLFGSLSSHDLHLPGRSIDYMCAKGVGKVNGYCYPIWLFTGFVVQ